MKITEILFCLTMLCISCSDKLYKRYSVEGKTFESKAGPLYKGNRLIFHLDSTFTYIGHGPPVFLSEGIWKYDSVKNELILKSRQPEEKYVNPISVDTLWVEIDNKKIEFISPKKIVYEHLTYYKQ